MFRIGRDQINLRNTDEAGANDGSNWRPEKAAYQLWEAEAEANVDRHRVMAEQILQEAQDKAESIIKKAYGESLAIKAEARDSGFDQGMQEAQSLLDERMEEENEMLSRLMTEISNARDRMIDDAEQDFIDLALAMVKKIVNIAVEKDDTVFESMLKKALQSMKLEGKLTIRVSDREYERYFSDGTAVFSIGEETVGATVVADSSVPHLGCIVESDTQIVNAGLDEQLKTIAIAFHQTGNEAV